MGIPSGGILPLRANLINCGADIIIYPGQSNTVGWGNGDYTDSDQSNDSRIFQVSRGLVGSDMSIVPMMDDTEHVRNPLQYWEYDEGRGYGVTFARLYSATLLQPGRCVIIIPAAHGSTSILQWLQLIDGPSGAALYDDMAARIDIALKIPGSRIVGWIENQGETDANIALNPADPNHTAMPDADTYLARKRDLIDKVRGDFGMFPMIFGLFSDPWVSADRTGVRLAFENAIKAASVQRPFCTYTDTTGVQSNYDIDHTQFSAHFSAAGQEDLAARHFATYCNMLKLSGRELNPAIAQNRTEAIAALVPNWSLG